MKRWYLVTMILASFVISGCAGRTRRELSRLQSQVGVLDQRVTQLERLGGGSMAASFGESSGPMGTTMPDTLSSEPSGASKRKSTAASTAPASLKPTTREIQQALKNAGFYQGAIDGKTGPLTREAIKEFQRVHGLNDDGVVGKQTWAKLRAYANLTTGNTDLNAAESLK